LKPPCILMRSFFLQIAWPEGSDFNFQIELLIHSEAT
jgi:hypothetical protein